METQKTMRVPRVILFEDDKNIREMLKLMLKSIGCEIVTYEDPSMCPLHKVHTCQCGENERCADMVITDMEMPNVSGLDFVHDQLRRGCKIKYSAVVSGFWTDESVQRAQELGCKIFHKPSFFYDLESWVNESMDKLDLDVKLSDWFIKA